METLPLRILHNQIDVLGRVDCLVQLNDTCVIQSTQNTYFSDCLFFALIFLHQLCPVVLFYGHFLTTRLVDAFFDYRICPVTDLLSKLVNA